MELRVKGYGADEGGVEEEKDLVAMGTNCLQSVNAIGWIGGGADMR